MSVSEARHSGRDHAAATERRGGLVVFSDDWGRHPSSCQHLVGRLLSRRQALWVNTIGTRPPRFDRATLARGLEKARGWARPRPARPRDSRGPHVVSPKMWPWFRSGLDRRLNAALLSRQLAPLVAALPRPRVVVTSVPLVADLVGRLPVDRWVYYCADDLSTWPGADGTPLRRMERLLLERVDAVIAVSEALREALRKDGPSPALLTHGADLAHWRREADGDPLAELDGLGRPLVTFWGLVDRRLDLAVLERLAADLTEGTILLVGPESDPDPALGQIARVARVPALPYARLPALARASDVLIMPYADLPVTRAMQPLKLKEYLASGRPAVAADLPANRDWADALDLAATPEAFSAAVRLRLATGLPGAQGLARGRLDAEGWESKALEFERLVFDGLEGDR
jgi:glycosyltransferase involved in cell wall biosynthesis